MRKKIGLDLTVRYLEEKLAMAEEHGEQVLTIRTEDMKHILYLLKEAQGKTAHD